ncbi:hypothetical protein BH11BAC6_BH11BAC6_01560 [soil metagenome]
MSADSFNQYARQEQVTDSFLHTLQQNNEVVLAFAVETFAWAKTVNYHIIALNKNEWKGYTYYINKSSGNLSKLMEVSVSEDECSAVWKFIQDKQAWKIKGDDGTGFCSGSQKSNCNINDGAGWRLLIIIKDKIADPAYYEPAFYEECCPGNEERKLFIEVSDKIKNAVKLNDNGAENKE